MHKVKLAVLFVAEFLVMIAFVYLANRADGATRLAFYILAGLCIPAGALTAKAMMRGRSS